GLNLKSSPPPSTAPRPPQAHRSAKPSSSTGANLVPKAALLFGWGLRGLPQGVPGIAVMPRDTKVGLLPGFRQGGRILCYSLPVPRRRERLSPAVLGAIVVVSGIVLFFALLLAGVGRRMLTPQVTVRADF